MADGSKGCEDDELLLELSIGGIFDKLKKPNQNASKSIKNRDGIEDFVQLKRQIQANRRREFRRKREEKLMKLVDLGSCGSVSGPFAEDKEWLEKHIVDQNDDGLEVEPARKKERVERLQEDVNYNKSCGFRQTVCRSLTPNNMNLKADKDEIDGGGRRICKVNSNGCGSSAYSDGQCSSHQCIATDDSRSNSSNSQLDQQLASADPSDSYDQPTGSSKQTVSTINLTNSTVSDLGPANPHESSVSNPPCKPDQTRIDQLQQVSVLARMPRVSTTGNGPNGKTVNGFLYRYTKSEVSIVCVCHGQSFNPGGFVEHAGGVGIAYPLKHITIFPTAFAS